MFDFCDEGAGEKEGAQKREENGPGMVGVGYGGKGGCEDADWGEGVARIGAIDEGEGCGDGDVGFHAGLDGEEEEDRGYLLSSSSC